MSEASTLSSTTARRRHAAIRKVTEDEIRGALNRQMACGVNCFTSYYRFRTVRRRDRRLNEWSGAPAPLARRAQTPTWPWSIHRESVVRFVPRAPRARRGRGTAGRGTFTRRRRRVRDVDSHSRRAGARRRSSRDVSSPTASRRCVCRPATVDTLPRRRGELALVRGARRVVIALGVRPATATRVPLRACSVGRELFGDEEARRYGQPAGGRRHLPAEGSEALLSRCCGPDRRAQSACPTPTAPAGDARCRRRRPLFPHQRQPRTVVGDRVRANRWFTPAGIVAAARDDRGAVAVEPRTDAGRTTRLFSRLRRASGGAAATASSPPAGGGRRGEPQVAAGSSAMRAFAIRRSRPAARRATGTITKDGVTPPSCACLVRRRLFRRTWRPDTSGVGRRHADRIWDPSEQRGHFIADTGRSLSVTASEDLRADGRFKFASWSRRRTSGGSTRVADYIAGRPPRASTRGVAPSPRPQSAQSAAERGQVKRHWRDGFTRRDVASGGAVEPDHQDPLVPRDGESADRRRTRRRGQSTGGVA